MAQTRETESVRTAMAGQARLSPAPPEVGWDRLDKTKFYLVGAGLFSGISIFLFPISVVKTRMQVSSGKREGAAGGTGTVVRSILRADGVKGLYRGFGTVLVGTIPSRVIMLTSLETTKLVASDIMNTIGMSEAFRVPLANGIAGLISSLLSQCVFVPIDVISQRLMVQGTSDAKKYSGGLDAAHKIIKADGIRGLYRGFGLSVMTYAPTSAVWWASYGAGQRLIWKGLGYNWADGDDAKPKQWQVVSVQAAGGIIAGAVSSIITTPLDTIKTRLQVIETAKRPTILSTVRTLLKDHGPKGFYKGLGPRFVSMSAWGTCMIVSYEFLSKWVEPFMYEIRSPTIIFTWKFGTNNMFFVWMMWPRNRTVICEA